MSLKKISFFQALALSAYCSLIASLLAYGNQWLGKMPQILGSFLFLLLFSASALICGLITLSYPAVLFLKKKQPGKALKLIAYTIFWLLLLILFFIIGNLIL